jgi:flagellin-like protein
MYTTKKSNNDEAVSPVIGVILMVAITVILAAVIAAFVFGMAGSIGTTKVVAVTAQQPDADSIVVTYQGGKDATTCSSIDITVTSADTSDTNSPYEETLAGAGTPVTVPVGSSVTITAGTGFHFSGKDHVVAVAHFSDGTDQVVLDNTI